MLALALILIIISSNVKLIPILALTLMPTLALALTLMPTLALSLSMIIMMLMLCLILQHLSPLPSAAQLGPTLNLV